MVDASAQRSWSREQERRGLHDILEPVDKSDSSRDLYVYGDSHGRSTNFALSIALVATRMPWFTNSKLVTECRGTFFRIWSIPLVMAIELPPETIVGQASPVSSWKSIESMKSPPLTTPGQYICAATFDKRASTTGGDSDFLEALDCPRSL